jgi:hypothetical protein
LMRASSRACSTVITPKRPRTRRRFRPSELRYWTINDLVPAASILQPNPLSSLSLSQGWGRGFEPLRPLH